MIRTVQTCTARASLALFLILTPAAFAEDTPETLPAPAPTAATAPMAATRHVEFRRPSPPRVSPHARSPVEVYRNGKYGRSFGDFYRDRNGGFFYGYDSRYRFGIHR